MTSSFSPANLPYVRRRQPSSAFGRVFTMQLAVCVFLPLLFPSLVDKATLTTASGQSSFEFAAYCQKLCIWGRGGNLCRCNAVHFVGKRRTLDVPLRKRVDRSVNLSIGNQVPDGTAEGSKRLLASNAYKSGTSPTEFGVDYLVINDNYSNVVDDPTGGMPYGQQLETNKGIKSERVTQYSEDPDRPSAVIAVWKDGTNAKRSDEVFGGYVSRKSGTDGKAQIPMFLIKKNGSRYRRKNSYVDDVIGQPTSVDRVTNVLFRRADEDRSQESARKSPPSSSSMILVDTLKTA